MNMNCVWGKVANCAHWHVCTYPAQFATFPRRYRNYTCVKALPKHFIGTVQQQAEKAKVANASGAGRTRQLLSMMAVSSRKKEAKTSSEEETSSVKHTSQLEGKVRKIIGGYVCYRMLVFSRGSFVVPGMNANAWREWGPFPPTDLFIMYFTNRGCVGSALIAGILNVVGYADLDNIPVIGWSLWYGTGVSPKLYHRIPQSRMFAVVLKSNARSQVQTWLFSRIAETTFVPSAFLTRLLFVLLR